MWYSFSASTEASAPVVLSLIHVLCKCQSAVYTPACNMHKNTHMQLGKSPLWSAIFKGHQKCVLLLIDAGANINVQKAVSVSSSEIGQSNFLLAMCCMVISVVQWSVVTFVHFALKDQSFQNARIMAQTGSQLSTVGQRSMQQSHGNSGEFLPLLAMLVNNDLNLCPLNLDPRCLCVFTCLSLNSVEWSHCTVYSCSEWSLEDSCTLDCG